MDITITGLSTSTCGHRIVSTDKGDIPLHLSEIQNADPRGFAEVKEAAIIVLKHQYLSRIAAGRTVTQALADLRSFVVRI